MKPVHRPKGNALQEIFGRPRVVIGVVHCLPLPGSPEYGGEGMEQLCRYAVTEALHYQEGGVHGLIIENHGDIPFAKPEDLGLETAAVMSVIADRVRAAVSLPIGINVLANAALHATAIATAGQAAFIRVNQWANAYVANEGLIEGPAAKVTRYRSLLRSKAMRIFADVHVKHGAHAIVGDRTIAELTRDVEFFDADVVIGTGNRTGDPASLDELAQIKNATYLPVLVGSGVAPDNVESILRLADGAIIGSALKEDGVWWNPVSVQRTRDFMKVVNAMP
jgi:uncharacterized protein